mmetsp:Transcript_17751/g.30905  ORF Transcript_17751/g.30905 Transcript_17751/m.30905 type:complete len:89 (-) Transcript_17751:640-906(-)
MQTNATLFLCKNSVEGRMPINNNTAPSAFRWEFTFFLSTYRYAFVDSPFKLTFSLTTMTCVALSEVFNGGSIRPVPGCVIALSIDFIV